MHRRLLLLLIGLGATGLLPAQDSVFYSILWKPEALYRSARVSQEGIFHYPVVAGKAGGDSVLQQILFYDVKGKLVKQQDYRNNNLRTRLQFWYTNDRLDSMVQEDFWWHAVLLHKYTHDTAGNLMLDETFHRGVKTQHLRYVYNQQRQLIERYKKTGEEREQLLTRYTYLPTKLLKQIDVFFEAPLHRENYSIFYKYDNRTVTRFFQRATGNKRFIDCIRTYNEADQLMVRINPPLPANAWRPADVYNGTEEQVETSAYNALGLVLERQLRQNDKLAVAERHYYFFHQ